jgi:hypothetical protein
MMTFCVDLLHVFAYNHSELIQPICIFSASLAWLIFLPSLSHKEATHYTNAPVLLLPNLSTTIYVYSVSFLPKKLAAVSAFYSHYV